MSRQLGWVQIGRALDAGRVGMPPWGDDERGTRRAGPVRRGSSRLPGPRVASALTVFAIAVAIGAWSVAAGIAS